MSETLRFPLPSSRPSREWIEQFCRRWKIAELSVFGSIARGDFRPDSDVDLLVTFEPGESKTIREHLAMEAELREVFGRKVDLVELRLVQNPFRRYNILRDAKVLFPVPSSRADQLREGPDLFEQDIGSLWDIVKAARKVITITEGMTFETYLQESIPRMAVERCLITVGEAVRALSLSFRASHPEIPWSEIIGERNILVHQYSEIDDAKVWGIATVEVPRLLNELEPLVPREPNSNL